MTAGGHGRPIAQSRATGDDGMRSGRQWRSERPRLPPQRQEGGFPRPMDRSITRCRRVDPVWGPLFATFPSTGPRPAARQESCRGDRGMITTCPPLGSLPAMSRHHGCPLLVGRRSSPGWAPDLHCHRSGFLEELRRPRIEWWCTVVCGSARCAPTQAVRDRSSPLWRCPVPGGPRVESGTPSFSKALCRLGTWTSPTRVIRVSCWCRVQGPPAVCVAPGMLVGLRGRAASEAHAGAESLDVLQPDD